MKWSAPFKNATSNALKFQFCSAGTYDSSFTYEHTSAMQYHFPISLHSFYILSTYVEDSCVYNGHILDLNLFIVGDVSTIPYG